MKAFDRPRQSFAGLQPADAARLAGVVADLVLVVDAAGIVVDLCLSTDEFPADVALSWIGRPLHERVAPDSVPKLAELMAQARSADPGRWRQLNVVADDGGAHMLQCAAVPLGAPGTVALVCRSLQSTMQMQQRLVQAQQAMERDYWQFRQVETRYRQLFQATSEGVLVLDAETLGVVEANPAACRLLQAEDSALIGQALPALFGPAERAVQTLLAGVRAAGQAAEVAVPHDGDRAGMVVAASSYRQGGQPQLLVRLARRAAAAAPTDPVGAAWIDLVRSTPDGLVLTDGDGRVLAANAAFLELAQLGAEAQVRGESLDRWLGRSGVDLNVLLSNLRQRGMVRLFATRLRGEFDASAEVEISAVQVSQEPPLLGFTVRDVGRRLGAAPRGLQEVPRSVAQLTELVGRVPLKDIVGETTDLIEQLCIEAALELTRGNRAAAAEMLGLSRQSLYVKLRRFGLKDLGPESEK